MMSHTVTQTAPKNIEALIKKADRMSKSRSKSSAFTAWQQSLNSKDKLPRGKFFEGKKSGRPPIILDEAHYYPSDSFLELRDKSLN
jgi:hypothetical protein